MSSKALSKAPKQIIYYRQNLNHSLPKTKKAPTEVSALLAINISNSKERI